MFVGIRSFDRQVLRLAMPHVADLKAFLVFRSIPQEVGKDFKGDLGRGEMPIRPDHFFYQ